MAQKTCFVVMGFGKKTDYRQGKTFDLDKTYRTIIKPAVESAGLECVRADEIPHSGVIDLPMYEKLLSADVVVADLSTSNFNAAYELGVRHALRPFSTIAMAERGFAFPFDVNHVAFLTYEHLESGIDYEEVERVRAALSQVVEAAAGGPSVDSPVYTFLQDLDPPARAGGRRDLKSAAPAGDEGGGTPQAAAELRSRAEELRKQSKWAEVVQIWGTLAQLVPTEPFYTQQHALATYKAAEKAKDDASQPRRGYLEAVDILKSLNPRRSGDPETLGTWAAVHKRLYQKADEKDEAVRAQYLERAIDALQKGFLILNDYYNGINLAYMLDVRGAGSSGDDAITDHTTARRVRRRVIEICEALTEAGDFPEGDEYWVKASAWEAHVGLGDGAQAERWKKMALDVDGFEGWMEESTREQIGKLTALLEGRA